MKASKKQSCEQL